MPYAKLYPFLAGAALGVAPRIVFSGKPDSAYAAMRTPFVLFVPIAVGVVTAYVAERRARRSFAYHMGAEPLANVLFVLGTVLIAIEGFFCAIIIVPVFALLGALGAFVMAAICRFTGWPKPAAYGFAVLPLLLALLLPIGKEVATQGEVERVVSIDASPAAIWKQLLDLENIRPEEMDSGWAYRIGVPLPLSAVTEETDGVLVRRIKMDKSIYFDQISEDWHALSSVRWRNRFYEDSFPPNTLDEHVRIGGRYFDIIDTEYSIMPLDADHCILKARIRYRVSTDFNWYTDAVARLLIGNFEEVALQLYRRRAES